MSNGTLITMSRELFKKYIDEAYECGKAKGRAEEAQKHKANAHKSVKLEEDEEFKANIVEE